MSREAWMAYGVLRMLARYGWRGALRGAKAKAPGSTYGGLRMEGCALERKASGVTYCVWRSGVQRSAKPQSSRRLSDLLSGGHVEWRIATPQMTGLTCTVYARH